MSFDQDQNEQANISGADLAILLDELKELKQQLSEAKQQAVPEWQPIETAPKDKGVLVMCNGHVFSAAQDDGKWYWGILVPEHLKLSLVLNPTH